jgi:NAD+ kinase
MRILIIGRKNGQAGSAHLNISDLITSFVKACDAKDHYVLCDDDTVMNFKVHVDQMISVADHSIQADVIVVFGGDGTMLHVTKAFAHLKLPLLGINLGRLGFITDVPHDFDPDKIIDMLERQAYTIEQRSLLSLTKGFDSVNSNKADIALNEVVISQSTGKVIEFQVFIDDEYAYVARGDGLMISTPTGSTGYALSTGAPIIHPTAKVLEVIPIFPQTLSCRPLIINDTSVVKFKLINGEADVFVDGNEVNSLWVKDAFRSDRSVVTITSSKQTIRLIHPKLNGLTYDYYNTLREKLQWQHLPGTPRP